MNRITIISLFTIFAAALILRTVKLSSYPVGFHIDEASLGYNGYSILLTGMSDEGKRFPLYVDMFGDNRPTGYHYLTTIPIRFLGLTETSTRLPGAVFGALTVFPFFLMSLLLFKSKKIALFASLLLAISPWSVISSRASAEAIVALFFIILGFYLLFSFIKAGGVWKLTLGTASLIASFLFYHTPRVFVPMYFLIAVLVLYWPLKKLKEKKILIGAFLVICVISFILIFIVRGGTGRFAQVNIFGHPETKLVTEEQIREDGTIHAPLFQTRIFHNKVVNYSLTFISNYFSYFSGDFLFINGGLPIWYKVDRVGRIFLLEFPFILYGIYLCFRSKDIYAKLPLFWILAAPVTASFTMDDVPNLQRSIVLFPMLELMAAVGIVGFLKTKKVLLGVFVAILVFNFSYFLHQYFVHGKTHRTWYRNNSFSKMMNVVMNNYGDFDKVVATKAGGGYPLFLFFSKYDPATYIREGSPKDKDFKGFGKFVFSPYSCPSVKQDLKLPKGTKVLFVDFSTCKEPEKMKFTNIYREDGSLGFRVIYGTVGRKGVE